MLRRLALLILSSLCLCALAGAQHAPPENQQEQKAEQEKKDVPPPSPPPTEGAREAETQKSPPQPPAGPAESAAASEGQPSSVNPLPRSRETLQLHGSQVFTYRTSSVSGGADAFQYDNYGYFKPFDSMTMLNINGPLIGNVYLQANLSRSQFYSGQSRWLLSYPGMTKFNKNFDLAFGDLNVTFTGNQFVNFSGTLRGFTIDHRLGKKGKISLLAAQKDATYINPFSTSGSTNRQPPVFPGNGTPGPYALPDSPIVPETEIVRVDERPQVRGVDYTIDYDFGTLMFLRGAIPPTSTIAVSYEVRVPGQKSPVVYGLRWTHDPSERMKLGFIYLAQRAPRVGGAVTRPNNPRFRQEFSGTNSVGPFQLNYRPVVLGSEVVTVQAVIQRPDVRFVTDPSTGQLTPIQQEGDYHIDYFTGTITFFRPIAMGQLIVVEYTQNLVSETTQPTMSGDRSLMGFDAAWQWKKNWQFAFELARSGVASGDAGGGIALSLRSQGRVGKRLNLSASLRSVSDKFQPIESSAFLSRSATEKGINLDFQYGAPTDIYSLTGGFSRLQNNSGGYFIGIGPFQSGGANTATTYQSNQRHLNLTLRPFKLFGVVLNPKPERGEQPPEGGIINPNFSAGGLQNFGSPYGGTNYPPYPNPSYGGTYPYGQSPYGQSPFGSPYAMPRGMGERPARREFTLTLSHNQSSNSGGTFSNSYATDNLSLNFARGRFSLQAMMGANDQTYPATGQSGTTTGALTSSTTLNRRLGFSYDFGRNLRLSADFNGIAVKTGGITDSISLNNSINVDYVALWQKGDEKQGGRQPKLRFTLSRSLSDTESNGRQGVGSFGVGGGFYGSGYGYGYGGFGGTFGGGYGGYFGGYGSYGGYGGYGSGGWFGGSNPWTTGGFGSSGGFGGTSGWGSSGWGGQGGFWGQQGRFPTQTPGGQLPDFPAPMFPNTLITPGLTNTPMEGEMGVTVLPTPPGVTTQTLAPGVTNAPLGGAGSAPPAVPVPPKTNPSTSLAPLPEIKARPIAETPLSWSQTFAPLLPRYPFLSAPGMPYVQFLGYERANPATAALSRAYFYNVPKPQTIPTGSPPPADGIFRTKGSYDSLAVMYTPSPTNKWSLGLRFNRSTNAGTGFVANSTSNDFSLDFQYRFSETLTLMVNKMKQDYTFLDNGSRTSSDMLSVNVQWGRPDGLNVLFGFNSIKSSSSEETSDQQNGAQSRALRQFPGGGFLPPLPRSGGFSGSNTSSFDARITYPLSQRMNLFTDLRFLNSSGGGTPPTKRQDFGLGVSYRLSDRIDWETTLARVSNSSGDASNAYKATTLESRLSINF